MTLVCIYCGRTDRLMFLDPDRVPLVATCADCWSGRAKDGTP